MFLRTILSIVRALTGLAGRPSRYRKMIKPLRFSAIKGSSLDSKTRAAYFDNFAFYHGIGARQLEPAGLAYFDLIAHASKAVRRCHHLTPCSSHRLRGRRAVESQNRLC